MTTNQTPSWETWPRLQELSFVLKDGSFMCCDCANRQNGSRAFAATDFGDEEHISAYPKGNTDDQWRIIGAQFNSEPVQCSHCNFTIPPLKKSRAPKFKS